MEYEFISNTNVQSNGNLYKYIEEGFKKAKSFCFSVAFINFAGVQIILDILKKSEKDDIKGKILTTNYLHFTASSLYPTTLVAGYKEPES